MLDGVVGLVAVLAQGEVEFLESPDSVVFWIHRLGDLADLRHELRIAEEAVDELLVRRVEHAFADTSKPCLCTRALLLLNAINTEQCLEIGR